MARSAAIVGGGIGGLAAAIGLHRAGWEVTVFERALGLPGSGTGLGIWPSALRALDELQVGARARQRGYPQPSGMIRRPDGSAIAGIDGPPYADPTPCSLNRCHLVRIRCSTRPSECSGPRGSGG